MRFIKKILISFLVTVSISFGGIESTAQCKVATHGFGSAVEIAIKAGMTTYNIFPIRVGGVKLFSFKDLEDFNTLSNLPTCICMKPPGIPVPGIKLSLWEPIAIVEPVALPLCVPTFGLSIPVSAGIGTSSLASVDTDNVETLNTYQAHYIKYPVFKILQLFLDFVCLDVDGSLDIGYLTEFDPLWQNDAWAAILGPEAFLVANPVAQMACIADSITAQFGFPLDPLWWCFGSWGSAFPLTMNVVEGTNITATANIVAKLLMKMHRELLLWGSVGEIGLCGKYPMPIMRKSQYGIFPIYPIGWPLRIPIGRTDLLWAEGQDIPFANMHVWAWMVYRKRDCCAF
ncbi:TraU family protein [Persephonella sp.]